MTIDASKIRPGDTGTIRVRFRGLGKDGSWWADYGPFGTPRPLVYIQVPTSVIASHTPAPWVPEKGDVVKWNGDRHNEDWTILGTHESRAWIRCSGYHETPHVSDLTLIRKGAA